MNDKQIDALVNIVVQAQNNAVSVTGYKKFLRDMKVLGLTKEQYGRVGFYLGYTYSSDNADGNKAGDAYKWITEKLNK